MFPPVQLEWTPEPTAEEREALDRALVRLLAEREDPRGAWWREGVAGVRLSGAGARLSSSLLLSRGGAAWLSPWSRPEQHRLA